MSDAVDQTGPETKKQLVKHGWPWPLAKAVVEKPFDYAVGLRDGTVIRFQGAKASDDMAWVELDGTELQILKAGNSPWLEDNNFNFERGLVVRVDDIVWASDAPFGS